MHRPRIDDEAVVGVILGLVCGAIATGWAEAMHWQFASAHGPPEARTTVIGAIVGAFVGGWLGNRLARDAPAAGTRGPSTRRARTSREVPR